MKKPKIKKITLKRRKKVDSPEYIERAAENAPRITNETIAVHREEVLSTARKYILPLQHSKHQVVLITSTLFVLVVVAFFTYCTLALYKFHTSSTFLYRVTQVIPFPIARTGGHFVAYENYFFELRRYTHYYENQQKTNFEDPQKRDQLVRFKKLALDKVVNDVYVKKLASDKHISVTDKEVDDQITTLRELNRLGGSNKVFEDVLKEYWGWSVADFRRSLRQQLLAQKLAATLDTTSATQANAALAELKGGAEFGAVAKKYSTDTATKDRAGEFGFAIDRTTRNISAQTINALFGLQPGQYSGVINVGNGLEIVKNIEVNGEKVRAAHIFFEFKSIDKNINDLKDQQKAQVYL